MKKNVLLFCVFFSPLILNASAPDQISGPMQNTDLNRYFQNLQKVITITQEAAQKAIAQVLENPTRSTATHEMISTTICNAIEEEIQKIKDESDPMTDEQKEILTLLEQYLAQYQAYSSFAVPTA